MRILIDSHVLVWLATNDSQLSSRASRLLRDARNDTRVSVASLWELSNKIAAGRLELPDVPEVAADKLRFAVLGVELPHIQRMRELPRHHDDPFDRMLIAQALVEDLLFVTSDRSIARYDVPMFW